MNSVYVSMNMSHHVKDSGLIEYTESVDTKYLQYILIITQNTVDVVYEATN